MKIGDKVTYSFPSPVDGSKKLVGAEISFVGSSRIILKCDDGSTLKVSFKNFNRISPVPKTVSRVKEGLNLE